MNLTGEYHADVGALMAELAALKASIPQAKHDAIIEAAKATVCNFTKYRVYEVDACEVCELEKFAANLLTQAQEQDT